MEALTIWVGKAMVTAWLSIGTMVGITPCDVSKAIAQASTERPLYAGPDGARRTAALMTAIGVFESGFDNHAKGDCKDRPPGWPGCGKDATSKPTSFCFLQVHFGKDKDGNDIEKVGGYTPDELMADPLACARTGREIMRASITNKANADEPLRSYAGTSGPARKRWDLALKLFRTVPEEPIRCE